MGFVSIIFLTLPNASLKTGYKPHKCLLGSYHNILFQYGDQNSCFIKDSYIMGLFHYGDTILKLVQHSDFPWIAIFL